MNDLDTDNWDMNFDYPLDKDMDIDTGLFLENLLHIPSEGIHKDMIFSSSHDDPHINDPTGKKSTICLE